MEQEKEENVNEGNSSTIVEGDVKDKKENTENNNTVIDEETDAKKQQNWREWKPETQDDTNKEFGKLYAFQDGSMNIEEVDDSSWKDVNWDENREKIAKLVLDQEIEKLSIEERQTYEVEAAKRWDTFYTKHQNNFFKLRNYLHLEYPELLFLDEKSNEDEVYEKLRELYPKQTIKKKEKMIQLPHGETAKLLEIGCGTGSTIYPIIQLNQAINPSRKLYTYAFDFAESAVNIVKANPQYNEEFCKAFVCDITEEDLIEEIRSNQIHIAMLIFVLSAIDPSKMIVALKRIFDSLKPGGLLIFRDYGLYDMTQMRFVAKKRRKIDENFYMRADGTRTYFFSLEKLKELMDEVGFETKELKFDTRELRNRKRGLLMYRVWINGKFTKPLS